MRLEKGKVEVLERNLKNGEVNLEDFVKFCELLVEYSEAEKFFKEKLEKKVKEKIEKEELENSEGFLDSIGDFIAEIRERCREFLKDFEDSLTPGRIKIIYVTIGKNEILALEYFSIEIYNTFYYIYIKEENGLNLKAVKEKDGKITEYKTLLEFFTDLYSELKFNELI